MEKDKELPSDDFFLSGERKAEFFEWCEKHADRLRSLEKMPAERVAYMLAIWDFQLESYQKAFTVAENAIETMRKIIEEDVPKRMKQQQMATTLHHWDAIKAKQERDIAFDIGRKKGRKIRKENTKKNREELDKAIADLFREDDSPGWKWSNSKIADFIHNRFSPVYAKSTIEQHVKNIAAKYRKKYKL